MLWCIKIWVKKHDDNGDYDDDVDDEDHHDHDEGARLLHSSTALGIEPDRLLEGVHSSTLCLRWLRDNDYDEDDDDHHYNQHNDYENDD